VQDAWETWCVPLCIDATAVAASNVPVNVTYTLYVYDEIASTDAELEQIVEDALIEAFRKLPIGGHIMPPVTVGSTGYLTKNWLEAVIIQAVAPHGFEVNLVAPSSDVSLVVSQVATLGTITPTIEQVSS